jgi:hypothetical protein
MASVGDSDNFRLYHIPGPGWRWPLKLRKVPSAAKGAWLARGVDGALAVMARLTVRHALRRLEGPDTAYTNCGCGCA